MRTRVRRWLPLLCFAVVVVAAAIFVRLIQRGEAPASEADRAQVYSAWWGFGAAVVTTFLWAWSGWRKATGAEPETATPDQVEEAAARLAEQTLQTWAQQAAVRGIVAPAPVRVRWRWATPDLGAARKDVNRSRPIDVDPIPLRDQGAEVLDSGVVTRLHDEVYARLRHGRLVLTGGPGAGKTGAMLLLLLAALRHRRDLPPEQRARVPVPVWLTPGSWNPDQQTLRDWVIDSLQRDHPYLTAPDFGPDAPARLFDTARIALFIDGLDELPDAHRPRAAQRLREETNGLRVVLTSRPDEYRAVLQAGEQIPNTAVLEMRPVGVGASTAYLLADRTPIDVARWTPLTSHLTTHPDGVLAEALSTPLTLSLARSAYQHPDTNPGQLLLPNLDTAGAVRRHLLDQAIVIAYPDQKERDHARYWLGWLAHHMNTRPDRPTRDLLWWHIPAALPRRKRLLARLVFGLVSGVVSGLAFGLLLGIAVGLAGGLLLGIANGLAVWLLGLPVGLVVGFLLVLAAGFMGPSEPKTLAPRTLSRREIAPKIGAALLSGILIGLLGNFVYGFTGWLLLVPGGLVGLSYFVWVLFDIWGRPTSAAADMSPRRTYEAERRYSITLGGGLGLLSGLMVGVMGGQARWQGALLVGDVGVFGLVYGLVIVVAVWLVVGFLGASGNLSLAQLGLRLTTRRRVRFIPLLEQALGRQVLRQVGTAYQFRHADLQDRLADHYKRENLDAANPSVLA